MKALICVLYFIAAVLFIGGCGWQLQGHQSNIGGAPYVAAKTLDALEITSSGRNSETLRSIKKSFTNNGITTDQPATIKLVLGRESLRRQPLTYSRSGIPAQYQLTVSLEYYVSRENDVLIEQRTIVARRNYDFDPNLIIAKDREEESLLEEMRQELSNRMMIAINQAL